jgi:hypothetical protein
LSFKGLCVTFFRNSIFATFSIIYMIYGL